MLTKSEYLKIKHSYKRQQYRWSKLKIGQFVYIEESDIIVNNYFRCVITAIDKNNRKISVLDLSQKEKPCTISYFYTEKELVDKGVLLKEPPAEDLEVSTRALNSKILENTSI